MNTHQPSIAAAVFDSRNGLPYRIESRTGFLHRNFTLQQFVGMRWQIERAEEQCERSGRRVSWLLQLEETPTA